MHNSRKKTNFQKESILVIRKNDLLTIPGLFGITPANMDVVFDTISTKGLFMDREVAENNENFKQIIPYLVYQYKKTFFFMQRGKGVGEQRLKDKYTLGIGGHIREEDLQNAQSIFDWAQREFAEEVLLSGTYKQKFLGMLNDDSNPVGRVHLGLVFLLQGNSAKISVQDKNLLEGKLLTLEELALYQDEMENWSNIVYKYLITQQDSRTSFKNISL